MTGSQLTNKLKYILTNMPITKKGKKIMSNMKKEYGDKKGKQVFYASKNAGKIKGVEGKSKKK